MSDLTQPSSPMQETPSSALQPEATPALSNNELSQMRTDMAQTRTTLAYDRTDLAETRTSLARERTRAAEERTILAWIRTSLSMIAFGFGIDRLFVYLNKSETFVGIDSVAEERVLGISLVSLGVFALIAALAGHWRTLKNIEERSYQYIPGWSLGLTVGIVLAFIGLATFVPLVSGNVNLTQTFTLDSLLVRNLVSLTIFSLMLTMGLRLAPQELISLWQHPGLLLRALVSTLIIFPAAVALVLYSFHLPEFVALGLILLAAAPGAPLLTKWTVMVGGNVSLAASLQVTLAMLAVVVTPLTLQVFAVLFTDNGIEVTTLAQVVRQVAVVQFLPLGIGIGIQQTAKPLAEDLGGFLTVIVDTLFAVILVMLLLISLDEIPQVGLVSLLAIGVTVIAGMISGAILAGKETKTQSTFVNGTIARNASLALTIATLNQQPEVIPTIIAYLLLGGLLVVPYTLWVKKQESDSIAEDRSPA